MTKVSVVDISDPDKITEILDGETEEPPKKTTKDQEDEDESDDEEDGVVPRLLFSTLSTLMMLVPLTSVHIGLDIIVHQQYAQSVDAVEIATRAATAALGISRGDSVNEVLLFLLGAIHPRKEAPIIRWSLFFAFIALGVAMVRVTREGAYYAVMVTRPIF